MKPSCSEEMVWVIDCGKVCEIGRFYAGSERVRELEMRRVVSQ